MGHTKAPLPPSPELTALTQLFHKQNWADTLLYDSSLGAWALLLLLNTPWLLLPVTALLLLFRCPIAFSLLACLSGAQGGTMQR